MSEPFKPVLTPEERDELIADLCDENNKLRAKCDEWNLSMDAVSRAVGFWQQAADERDALRAELDAQADVHTQIQMQLSDERDELRAKLAAERERAERVEGVLIQARVYLSGDAPRWANLANLLARIDAALNKGGE